MISAPAAGGERFFLGRAREVEDLCGALREARAGRGHLYLVRGEPGIGKTALVEEVAARAAAEGAAVLWGRCWEGESAPPYWPWLHVLRACLRGGGKAVVEQHPWLAQDLAEIVPELRPRRGDAHPKGDPGQARFRLFDAVTHFLRAVAAARPALLILDDLHAADAESLLLLRFLARDLRGASMLVVGTYREGEARASAAVRPLLAEIAREGRTLALGGFDEDEVRRFAAQRARTTPSDAALADLLRISEGNPFFVEEVVQLLRAEHRLAEASGGLRVPESVRDVIRRRIDCLPEETRDLLAIAAVLGREFDAAVLESTAGLAPGAAGEPLRVAAAANVVAGPAGAGRLRFSHVLIAETLYDDLPLARRVELHRRAAEALIGLEEDVESRLDEIAHHFLRAAPGGDVASALDWAIRAGDQALARLAYEAAASILSRALSALRQAPEAGVEGARREVELLLRIGAARLRSGVVAEAEELFLEAASRSRSIGDGPLLARAALGLGEVRFERGRPNATLVELLREALARLAPEEAALRARLLARLAQARGTDRGEITREAVEWARRSGDRGALASALLARHRFLWQPGSTAERLALAGEILPLAEDAGEEEQVLEALFWRTFDLLEKGDVGAWDLAVAQYERRAEENRLPRQRWYASVFRAAQALLRGRFAAAEALAAKGLEVRQAIDVSPSQFYGLQMFAIRREQGRLAELGTALRALLQHYPTVRGWACALALLHAEVGEMGEARLLFARLAAADFADFSRDFTWLGSMSMLAEICALVGDAPRATRLYDLLLPWADCNVVMMGTTVCRGPVAHFLGLLAGARGAWREAERHFEDAWRRSESMGAPALAAHAGARWAEALHRQGDAARSERLRQQALATARDLGMHELAARLEVLHSAPAPGGREASFRRDGDHWAVSYEGRIIRLKDSRGCAYLAHLLGRPGERVPSLALQAATEGEARAGDDEKARIAVRKAISVALRAIGGQHETLHRHLQTSVRTGRQCTYEPDPASAIAWAVDLGHVGPVARGKR